MEYEIIGGNLPVVVCHLKKGEKLTTESGGMSWMDPGIKMETSGRGLGKMFGRMLSGESLFLNSYTCEQDQAKIAFASSFPGDIKAVEITPGHEVIVQKSSFLACEASVELDISIQRKFSSGLFSGEGFVMNKLSNHGIAFIEIDGACVEYTLAPGQQIILDSGHLAMMDASCSLEIKQVPGLKNKLLGGEGLFNTVVTGPGKVYIQSIPASKLASSLIRYLPLNSNRG